MPQFDAILFDFDGVLVDSEPVHWACWAEVLKPLGVDLDWDYYRERCIGIDDREMLRAMAARANPPRDWHALWERYPEKKEMFRARMLQASPFDPALSGFLESLSGAYHLAVVSSSGRSEIEPLLVAGKIRDCFGALVCGSEAGKLKPEPEPYLLAAKLLGASRPLVVEDSAAGLASGRAAGFEVLAVKHPSEVPGLVSARLVARELPSHA